MQSHLQSLIAQLAAHPHAALAAVFAAAALEALAVVGTFIPGSTVVFAGGALVALGALDPWLAAGAAVAGAVLGDGLSYWLGRRYHERIALLWPLRSHPDILARGRAYFAERGGRSVFLGRFLPPVRAIVPVVAGMSDMPARRFFAMNALSAVAWAAAHLVPGMLFGASLGLAGAVSSRLIVLILAVAAFLWLSARVARFVIGYGWPRLRRLRHGIVRAARRRNGLPARIALSLLDPSRKESPALLAGALLLGAAAWLFLGILEDVASGDPLVQADRSVYAILQGLRTGWGDTLMVAVTELGGAAVTFAVVAAGAAALAITRRWRTLAYWLSGAGFAEVLVQLLKLTLGRHRPVEALYNGNEAFSFPSGHATMSIVVYGFLAFLLARGRPPATRIIVSVTTAAAIAAIAFSRLYLGAHWFSDVAAGMSLGLAWVALLAIAYTHHVREERLPAAWLLGGGAAALIAIGVPYTASHLSSDLERYAYRAKVRVLSAAGWRAEGWRRLPAYRAELAGEREEPLSVQWAGTGEAIAASLAREGWKRPPPWRSKAALLWLVPSTTIGELPVLPKLDRGEPPRLTFIRRVDARTRYVLRLWPARYALADGDPAPLWVGMATVEHLRNFAGLSLAGTAPDFDAPLRVLDAGAGADGVAVAMRGTSDRSVVLLQSR